MKLISCILAGALVFAASLHAASPAGKTQSLTSPDRMPEGLTKSDWQTIRAAYEAGRHAFAPVEGGWQWGLELKSYGFPGAERVVGGVPTVKAEGQRLTYDWDAAVQEWFVNDARGLEHGFTVKKRPAAALNFQPSWQPRSGAESGDAGLDRDHRSGNIG